MPQPGIDCAPGCKCDQFVKEGAASEASVAARDCDPPVKSMDPPLPAKWKAPPPQPI